jgi:hypothetical protein
MSIPGEPTEGETPRKRKPREKDTLTVMAKIWSAWQKLPEAEREYLLTKMRDFQG